MRRSLRTKLIITRGGDDNVVVLEQSRFRLKSPQNSIVYNIVGVPEPSMMLNQTDFTLQRAGHRQVRFNTYHTCVCVIRRATATKCEFSFTPPLSLPSHSSQTDYLLPVAAATPLGFKWPQSRAARDATCPCSAHTRTSISK